MVQIYYNVAKEPEKNKLVSWFSNFDSWQGATNAHSLSSVIEERRRQGAKGQTMGKLFLSGSLVSQETLPMERKNLQEHIQTLATLEEAEAPVISCYLSLEGSNDEWLQLHERVGVIRTCQRGKQREYFSAAFNRVEDYIANRLLPDARGAAIFSREGEAPFFLPLQFRAPLPTTLSIDSLPNIFPLVELSEKRERYIILFVCADYSRILEVNFGGFIKQLWAQNARLSEKFSKKASKQHYQSCDPQQSTQEKIAILEKIFAKSDDSHLILAGDQHLTSQIKTLLPENIKARLVDIIAASAQDRISKVVATTLKSLVKYEQEKGIAAAEAFKRQIDIDGPAVAGTEKTFTALMKGTADVLLFSQDYDPGIGWTCNRCGRFAVTIDNSVFCKTCKMRQQCFSTKSSHLIDCQVCGNNEGRKFDIKEEMVRLAAQNKCKLEILADNHLLCQLGGVGCLLRYAYIKEC